MKLDEDHHHKCRPFLKVHHFMATSLILWWKVREEKHFIPYSVLNNVDKWMLILRWIVIQFMGNRWEVFSLFNWVTFNSLIEQLTEKISTILLCNSRFRCIVSDTLFQIHYFRYTTLDMLFQMYTYSWEIEISTTCNAVLLPLFHHSKKVIH